VQLQWVTLNAAELGKSINPGEKQGSFLRGVTRYPPFLPTPNFLFLFNTNNIWK